MDSSTEHQIRNLNALLEISKALGSAVNLDQLLQLILEKTTEVMEAERSSLFLYDPKTDELWSKIAQGVTTQEIRFPIGVGIAGDVAKTLQLANIPDAYADPRFNQSFDKKGGFRTRSILCIPLVGTAGKLVGVIQVLNKKSGEPFNIKDEGLLRALGGHVAIALQRAQLIDSYLEHQLLEEALKLASEIQMSILPKVFPPFPAKTNFLDIYASICPAKEVGGDLYNFFMLDDDHLCFVIGDVSGKGVPASLFMAVTDTSVRCLARADWHPAEILNHVNDYLRANNDAGMFVTFFCGILNLQTGELVYANAGHNPPYVLHNDGTIEALTEHGGILGVIPDMGLVPVSLTLQKGEGIFLYTDGVSEAMNKDFEQYTNERLEALLKTLTRASAQEMVLKTIADVKVFVGNAPQSDDITVLAIRHL